jgi:adenine-specific DNA-methyltransferase
MQTDGQLPLSFNDPDPAGQPFENPQYLTRQLITYIGNKRALLPQIGMAVDRVRRRLGMRRLRVFDVFSGSGVVSRFLKAHATSLVANDLEDYAAVVSRCFLQNRSSVDYAAVRDIVSDLNARVLRDPLPRGFIEEMYAPRDESRIEARDRVFYTKENARRLDNYRRMIGSAPGGVQDLLLGPLLGRASVHANTAGVFKGFYKNRRTGVGQYGGSGLDAMSRIRGTITLEPPVLSDHECDIEVIQDDANAAAERARGIDLAYIDPPYNQHPYGSNYFMLNLLVRYERPPRVSAVSGIPHDWRRSGYNVRSRSLPLLRELLAKLDSRFLLISFNSEGFISPAEMRTMLAAFGQVEMFETPYNAFRGSRSFADRSIHVTEHLFLVERR